MLYRRNKKYRKISKDVYIRFHIYTVRFKVSGFQWEYRFFLPRTVQKKKSQNGAPNWQIFKVLKIHETKIGQLCVPFWDFKFVKLHIKKL